MSCSAVNPHKISVDRFVAGASLGIALLFETGDSRYVWLTRL